MQMLNLIPRKLSKIFTVPPSWAEKNSMFLTAAKIAHSFGYPPTVNVVSLNMADYELDLSYQATQTAHQLFPVSICQK